MFNKALVKQQAFLSEMLALLLWNQKISVISLFGSIWVCLNN
jgi:hypothetical protein